MVIGWFTDPDLIDSIFLRWKRKVNSIVEPYAMRKRCTYGCSSLLLFPIFCLRLIMRDRGTSFCYIIRVMMHQPASSFYEGSTGECVIEAEELLTLRETLTKVYAQRTGQPLWVLTEDLERDVFMSAREAQAHGIIDLIAHDRVEIVKKKLWQE